MTPSELDRIESVLQIKLPESYRRILASYPIPCEAGNQVAGLWDDVEALIACNRRLRGQRHTPWPTYLFFIGTEEGNPCENAIDLRDPAAPVWWVDHSDPTARHSGPVAGSFVDWAREYEANVRRDMAADGVDPDVTTNRD